jgi:CHRD domain
MRGRRLLLSLVLAALVALALAGAASADRLDVADHGGRPFSTELTGAEEVDPVTGAVGVGDPDGSGTATITLNPGQEEVCFELTVAAIDTPIGAHIHEGAAGTNGPVVVGLEPLPPTGDSSSSGCVSLERQEIIEILRDPSNYYVNVHTALFPDGAIRGQLP